MKNRNDSIVYPRFIITQTADDVNSRRGAMPTIFSSSKHASVIAVKKKQRQISLVP